jgi:hypothetical protein
MTYIRIWVITPKHIPMDISSVVQMESSEMVCKSYGIMFFLFSWISWELVFNDTSLVVHGRFLTGTILAGTSCVLNKGIFMD